MPIGITCGRCKKDYQLHESMAGKAVQCKRCRFIMMVPASTGEAAKPVNEWSSEPAAPPPPATDDWQAAVAMEQTAVATEAPIVIRRSFWDRFRKRESLIESQQASLPGVRARPPKADPKIMALASLPLAIALVLLYFFVPWTSIFGPSKPASPQMTEVTDTTPLQPPPLVPQTSPTGASPRTTPLSLKPTHVPIPASAPKWTPDPMRLEKFGPYLAYEGFAVRGPLHGLHLELADGGGIAWVGTARGGMRPAITITVDTTDDTEQTRPSEDPDKAASTFGWIGSLGCAHRFGIRKVSAGVMNVHTYEAYHVGKHAVIRIEQPSNAYSESQELMNSIAFSLRPAATTDVEIADGGTIPRAYDPAENPAEWTPDEALLALLMPVKRGYGYSIRPPQGLRLIEPGTWCGTNGKATVEGFSGGLPMLRVAQKPIDVAEFSTARTWADDQWQRLGRDVEWGTIDNKLFARVAYEASTADNKPASCYVYAGVVNGRFELISAAAQGTFESEIVKQLETAVFTFKTDRPSAPTSAGVK